MVMSIKRNFVVWKRRVVDKERLSLTELSVDVDFDLTESPLVKKDGFDNSSSSRKYQVDSLDMDRLKPITILEKKERQEVKSEGLLSNELLLDLGEEVKEIKEEELDFGIQRNKVKRRNNLDSIIYGKKNKFYNKRFLPAVMTKPCIIWLIIFILLGALGNLFNVMFCPIAVCLFVYFLLFSLRLAFYFTRALFSKYIDLDNVFLWATSLVLSIVTTILLFSVPFRLVRGPYYKISTFVEDVNVRNGYVVEVTTSDGDVIKTAIPSVWQGKFQPSDYVEVTYIQYLMQPYFINIDKD